MLAGEEQPRRGRKPDPIYGRLAQLFLEDGSERVEIDYVAMGRNPDTLQRGLNAAIKRLGLGERVRVSLLDGGERVLLRRRTGRPHLLSEATASATVRANTGSLGVEGLVFENDFVSISWDAWSERFPLVMNPDGDDLWGYGNNAAEILLDQQDPLCVWTLHHDSGDGSGDYIQSGRHRVNRLGYYVSTLPVPRHLKIQAWDEPWEPEEERYIRGAITEWQQEFGVDPDSFVPDHFESWFLKRHHDRRGLLNVELANLSSDRFNLELFDSIEEYHDIQLEMGRPSRSRHGLVERNIAEFDRPTRTETLDALIDAFLEGQADIWSMAPAGDSLPSGYELVRLLGDRLSKRNLCSVASVTLVEDQAALRRRG